jgi:hypothetical protein
MHSANDNHYHLGGQPAALMLLGNKLNSGRPTVLRTMRYNIVRNLVARGVDLMH